MQLKKLRALVNQGESEVLEFKSSTGSLTAGMQTVCAFLNSEHGGTVVFGVKDDGKIIGQEVTDKTRKDIAAELNKIDPQGKIDTCYVKVVHIRQAIVMQVSPGDNAPYTYDGRSYTRNQSTTQRLTQETSWHLFHKKRPTIWEKTTTSDCAINSLDKKRIRDVIRIAIEANRLSGISTRASIKEILTKLNLMVNDQLTNAAVILFYGGAWDARFGTLLQMARFNGVDKQEFLDNKAFHGNAFELYERALEFLGNHLPIAGKIESGNPYRVDTPALPYAVLREAIANAICHRDYSKCGQSIKLAVYDDRIEIDNPGGLPPGMTIDQLKKVHRSIPRNELIADVFFKCEIVERWGRGTTDMIKLCKAANIPAPKFEDKYGFFTVTLYFKEPIRYVKPNKISGSIATMLSARQKEILEILKHGSMSREHIIAQLRIPIITRTMQRELSRLRELELIETQGLSKRVLWMLIKK